MLMRPRIAPKTNISKAYYRHLVDQIEHDPLVRRSTLSLACFVAAICVLLGCLVWFANTHPGNLVRVPASVTGLSSGRTDNFGTITTFVTFDFKTRDGRQVSARQPAEPGRDFSEGQAFMAGYSPKNPNFARIIPDNRPPQSAVWLWLVPFYFLLWFLLVALHRHHQRQVVIWQAAEAADSDD